MAKLTRKQIRAIEAAVEAEKIAAVKERQNADKEPRPEVKSAMIHHAASHIWIAQGLERAVEVLNEAHINR